MVPVSGGLSLKSHKHLSSVWMILSKPLGQASGNCTLALSGTYCQHTGVYTTGATNRFRWQVLWTPHINRKSNRFLKDTGAHFSQRYLSGSWQLPLRQRKMSSVKEALFNSLLTTLFPSICRERQIHDFLPVLGQDQHYRAVRVVGQLGVSQRWDGKGATQRAQAGKGRVAGLATQFLRYRKLIRSYLLLSKAQDLANDYR